MCVCVSWEGKENLSPLKTEDLGFWGPKEVLGKVSKIASNFFIWFGKTLILSSPTIALTRPIEQIGGPSEIN